ncbi:hypothetical protein KP509_39G000900 [Ceratopteris richardii]|uniref:Serine incorporator n=1 Tax=Ceratopteris richardii TaxID=49495 RepID=A0A8T2PXX9_CERRI|nr:hypothetical protein KP509_39G000900 [Ceratopteris richardii]
MSVCGHLLGDCMGRTAFQQSCGGPHRLVARYIYGFIFLLINVSAWMVRDYSHELLNRLQYLKECEGGHDCLGSEGVLRISMGCFIFFFLMFLTTVGTKKINDPRDSWHSGWWPIKTLLFILVSISPFFVPPTFIHYYGEVARFGAGRIPMVITTAGSFAAALSGIILMYMWFAPKISCSLNITFITATLILIQLMTSISLHSKVNAGLMTSGLMAIYMVFLCWSAIMSEPLSMSCNTRPRQTGKGDWMTIASFVIAVTAIVIATMTTGTDSECFTFRKKEKTKSEDDVPYGYGFFHFVFAMGAMYFAMLFVGWNLHQTMHKWSIDVGWSSVWVKISSEWIAAAVYIWTMIGPFILRNRDFS